MAHPLEESFSNAVTEFRNRATKLRRNAGFIIAIIIVVLIAGILAFILAGTLASSESSQAIISQRQNRFSFLQDKINAVNKSISDNQEEAKNLQRKVEQETPNQNSNSGQWSLVSQLQNRLSKAEDKDKKLVEYLEKLEQQQLSLTEDSNSANDQAKSVSGNSYSILISAITTRIGSIVLLLFLVRILAPLYRYNIRLAAYFDARADALTLIHLNNSDFFQKLTASLSPEDIDFGESPVSPSQEMLDFIKQVLTSQKEK